MIQAQQSLIDIANEGQPQERGKIFKGEAFTRPFAGRVKDVVKLRNPLSLSCLVNEIDTLLEIINPALLPEIDWLNRLNKAIKLFHNEVIISNRLLGIKNDNFYDTRVFEKVVLEKFWMQLNDKPKPDTLIQTDFQTMVEMVELGVRRFGRS